MTRQAGMPFDHLAVAFAMLMSLGVARLLDGLRPALAPGARFWLHVVWILEKLLNLAFYWWMVWWLRAGVTWTAASFLWILLVPALLFLQATALATTSPAAIHSWREHFFTTRRWFFSAEVALVLHSIITSTVLRRLSWEDPFRLIQAMALATALLGLATARPRIHQIIGPLALGVQAFGLGTLFFRP